MSCQICHLPILSTVGHDEIKAKYIKLFRRIFPKKPFTLMYCTRCYESIVNDLESEIKSQEAHIKSYQEELQLLKENKKQDYSLMDHKKNQLLRYSILDEKSPEYQRIQEHFHKT